MLPAVVLPLSPAHGPGQCRRLCDPTLALQDGVQLPVDPGPLALQRERLRGVDADEVLEDELAPVRHAAAAGVLTALPLQVLEDEAPPVGRAATADEPALDPVAYEVLEAEPRVHGRAVPRRSRPRERLRTTCARTVGPTAGRCRSLRAPVHLRALHPQAQRTPGSERVLGAALTDVRNVLRLQEEGALRIVVDRACAGEARASWVQEARQLQLLQGGRPQVDIVGLPTCELHARVELKRRAGIHRLELGAAVIPPRGPQ
mmetsp:Transcript_48684/g.136973  ORF Transcript_48684/g.136973 Transcript_48684/m.136973 type:complete len:260 (+) Transcript_48684:536-1315(+)